MSGRRRIGKTYLLTHVWGERPYFFFTASRTSPEINRRQLLAAYASWSGQEIRLDDYPTWRTVFRLLLEGDDGPGKRIVVLDEFQYLGDDLSGVGEIASELNAVWERPGSKLAALLVLAGSAMATMAHLESGGSPLYGRFSFQTTLKPFDYRDANALAPREDLRERVLLYAALGGTPRYLAAVDTARSVRENLQALILATSGEVRTLIETALDQEEGLREVSAYRAILYAIAAGLTERNEIAQRVGLRNDNGLREKLGRLVALGYLEVVRNFDAKPSAKLRYRLADPAVRFYHHFVERNRSALERYPPAAVWDQVVEPHLDTFLGHAFETIVSQAYTRLTSRLGLPLIGSWGSWQGRDRAGRSLEIDLVARTLGGQIITGEIKWSGHPVSVGVHYAHVGKLERLAASGKGWASEALGPGAHLLYVSSAGFGPGFAEAASERGGRVWTLDLGALYG